MWRYYGCKCGATSGHTSRWNLVKPWPKVSKEGGWLHFTLNRWKITKLGRHSISMCSLVRLRSCAVVLSGSERCPPALHLHLLLYMAKLILAHFCLQGRSQGTPGGADARRATSCWENTQQVGMHCTHFKSGCVALLQHA